MSKYAVGSNQYKTRPGMSSTKPSVSPPGTDLVEGPAAPPEPANHRSLPAFYAELRYVDDRSNSKKFYRVVVSAKTAILWWGRIGSAGQAQTVDGSRMYSTIMGKVEQKIGKGYRPFAAGRTTINPLAWAMASVGPAPGKDVLAELAESIEEAEEKRGAGYQAVSWVDEVKWANQQELPEYAKAMLVLAE